MPGPDGVMVVSLRDKDDNIVMSVGLFEECDHRICRWLQYNAKKSLSPKVIRLQRWWRRVSFKRKLVTAHCLKQLPRGVVSIIQKF